MIQLGSSKGYCHKELRMCNSTFSKGIGIVIAKRFIITIEAPEAPHLHGFCNLGRIHRKELSAVSYSNITAVSRANTIRHTIPYV